MRPPRGARKRISEIPRIQAKLQAATQIFEGNPGNVAISTSKAEKLNKRVVIWGEGEYPSGGIFVGIGLVPVERWFQGATVRNLLGSDEGSAHSSRTCQRAEKILEGEVAMSLLRQIWSVPLRAQVRKDISSRNARKRQRCRGGVSQLNSEKLEARTLLAVLAGSYDEGSVESVLVVDASTSELTSTGSDEDGGLKGSGCPVCGATFCVTHLDSQGYAYAELSAIPRDAEIAPDSFDSLPPSASLADTFLLHSRPGATKKIYLDFDGHTTSGTAWKGGDTIVTPAYSVEGDSSFSNTELQNIQNIWSRVVENFAPFDVDVTTEEPSVDDLRKSGSGDQRWGIRVVIGQNTWGSGGAGVAYLGSFSWSSDTPCFVFPELLGFSNKNIAMATSHEIGHALGLSHDGGGGDGAYYRGHGSGDTSWAAIMGAGYGKSIQHWSKGEYRDANNQEDDLAIIVGAVTNQWTPNGNGFGYRPDDFGGTIETAHEPVFSEGFVASASVAGVIERFDDVDVFKFFTSETLQATISPAAVGPSLDILAKILDPSGQVLHQSNPFESLAASFTQTLASGYYYLTIEGTGKGDVLGSGYSDYGSLGQYSFELTVSGVDGPEVQVLDGGESVVDGVGAVDLGATPIGNPVTKTFTVNNVGTSDLVVQPVAVPAGFTVTSNLTAGMVIPAGGSTTFDVQLDATAIGTYSGTLSFANTDSNENPFDFTISGTVDPPPAPEIQVRVGATGLADGVGSFDFGRIPLGGSPSRVFTVENVGNLDLVVQPVAVPAGFTVVSNLAANQVIPAGANASFEIRFDAASVGSLSGMVSFANSDADESPFDFTITAEGYRPPTVQIVDDGDVRFSSVGYWGVGVKSGLLGDHRYARPGNGSAEARWAFEVSPGRYRVSATWKAERNRATDSPFVIFDGANPFPVVAVNQEHAPEDLLDVGARWKDLGGPFDITGTNLIVSLSNAADQYVIADAVRIERLGDVPAPRPEIEVFVGVSEIEDGLGSFDFGRTRPGNPVSETFTVRNVGNEDLTVQPVAVPAGFTVTSNLAAGGVIPAGESSTFVVRMDGIATGSYGGVVSFVNSDADESPFNFTIQGAVGQPPAVQILDDGDDGFVATGRWGIGTRSGFQHDHRFSAAGGGYDSATWTFAVTPGLYRVSATWSGGLNRATNSPFTVADGGNLFPAVSINQERKPNDLEAAGISWEDLGGPYTITGSTLVVTLTDAANQYVIADAVRIERLGDPPAHAPDVQVFDGETEILDGAGSVDFGSTPSGIPISKNFTVKNNGDQGLTVQPVTVPNGFSVTSNLIAGSVIPPDGSATFVVELDAVNNGPYSGLLQFVNTDADENPFDFAISGVVADPPAVQVLDDGDSGFATTGAWGVGTRSGHHGDHRYSAAGNGTATATWTFTVTPGEYRVSASWKGGRNRATNSPFTVADGTNAFPAVVINQERTPDDFTTGELKWEDLGDSYTITGTTLAVTLSDAANQYVIADAVRIERLNNPPTPDAEVQVFDGATEILDGSGSVHFGSTPMGKPAVKTFTVKNNGTQGLTVQPVTVPSGFTVTANLTPGSVIPVGGSATFDVQLDAISKGSYAGILQFGNSDTDENPFNFAISGVVADPPTTQIIDDGDAGFATSGQWGVGRLSGYQGDHRYSSAGAGTATATWTFGVMPGEYRIAASWQRGLNRATNAPFTVADGGNVLQTVSVNQEVAPNDFNAAGLSWENLGSSFTITGNTIVVTLTDAANEYVIADAVRIERIGPAV